MTLRLPPLLDKVHFLFLALAVSILVPSAFFTDSPWAFFVVIVGVEAVILFQARNPEKALAVSDIGSFFYLIFLAWELLDTKTKLVWNVILPPPEQVFNVFVDDYAVLGPCIASSLTVLVCGLVPAIVAGTALGLLVGWFPGVRDVVYPIVKVVNAVPAIVYIPYAILILPVLELTIVFIIFYGIFLSTFMNMIYEVGTINRYYVDAAKTLTVKTPTMLFKVILPAALPGILGRLTVSVSHSFILLVAAELVGAKAGIGYYIELATPLAAFHKELAAILSLSGMVILSQILLKRLENRLLYWMH